MKRPQTTAGCRHPVALPKSQRGGLLFTTLCILLVITVLAASAVRLSAGEQRMATNAHAASLAFHASESAINTAIRDDDALMEAATTGAHTLVVDLGNPLLNSSADITLTGEGPATGFSLGVDGGAFTAYQFEIRGRGETTGLPSSAEAIQGYYRIAPGG